LFLREWLRVVGKDAFGLGIGGAVEVLGIHGSILSVFELSRWPLGWIGTVESATKVQQLLTCRPATILGICPAFVV